jgi:hypothetical protein
MAEQSIRFAITDGDCHRAATWKCWTSPLQCLQDNHAIFYPGFTISIRNQAIVIRGYNNTPIHLRSGRNKQDFENLLNDWALWASPDWTSQVKLP